MPLSSCTRSLASKRYTTSIKPFKSKCTQFRAGLPAAGCEHAAQSHGGLLSGRNKLTLPQLHPTVRGITVCTAVSAGERSCQHLSAACSDCTVVGLMLRLPGVNGIMESGYISRNLARAAIAVLFDRGCLGQCLMVIRNCNDWAWHMRSRGAIQNAAIQNAALVVSGGWVTSLL